MRTPVTIYDNGLILVVDGKVRNIYALQSTYYIGHSALQNVLKMQDSIKRINDSEICKL